MNQQRSPLEARPVQLARLGTRLGVAAGGAWLVLGIESTVRGGEMHYRDTLWLVPWVLTILTFASLHGRQRHALTRAGRASALAVGMTMVLVLLGNVGPLIGIDALKVLGFPTGAILWVAAMVPFGVATVRAGVVGRRAGMALIGLEPLSILTGLALSPIAGLHDRGNYSGGIEKGVVLLIIAAALATSARGRSKTSPVNLHGVPEPSLMGNLG